MPALYFSRTIKRGGTAGVKYALVPGPKSPETGAFIFLFTLGGTLVWLKNLWKQS